jgi:hypothetical protein
MEIPNIRRQQFNLRRTTNQLRPRHGFEDLLVISLPDQDANRAIFEGLGAKVIHDRTEIATAGFKDEIQGSLAVEALDLVAVTGRVLQIARHNRAMGFNVFYRNLFDPLADLFCAGR